MISISPNHGVDIVSQTAGWIAVAEDPVRTFGLLRDIDRSFLIASVVLVAMLGIVVSRRRASLSLSQCPRRPNRMHEDAIGLVVVGYLMGYVVAAGAVQLIWGSLEALPAQLLIGVTAQAVGIAACLAVAGSRFDDGVAGLLGIGSASSGSRNGLIVVVLIVLALGLCPLVGEGTVMFILRFAPDYSILTHPTLDALHDPGRSILTVLALWLSAVVMAPLAEELFFRGILQTFLVNVFGRRWPAIAMASVVFGVVHFSQPHAIAALILLGVFLGYAYERSGSLIPAILVHASFNLKTLVWDAIASASS